MDGQADRAGELVGQQRAPGPAALDHPVGALLGVALQGSLRALVVGGQAVLVEETGDGAVQQQAFFAGQQGLADAFQRLGVAVDQQLAELLVVVALGLEGAYVLQVEHADMGGADLLDHQAQGIMVGADVRIADPHQVAEHPAIGADGDLRARCIEQLDALAQVVEERQRQALGHVRTAVEDLAGVRRLGRKRRQDEFDGLAGFDEGGDARQLDLFDAADLVRFAGALAMLGVTAAIEQQFFQYACGKGVFGDGVHAGVSSLWADAGGAGSGRRHPVDSPPGDKPGKAGNTVR